MSANSPFEGGQGGCKDYDLKKIYYQPSNSKTISPDKKPN
jgi:hypothetical protein